MATTATAVPLDQVGAGRRIAVRGAVDAATCGRLDAALREIVGSGALLVAVDLGDVRFLDSSGLRVLARWAAHLREEGGALLVEGASGATRRVLELAGVLHELARTGAGAARR